MCPLCISSMALTMAGATSTGASSSFIVRRFAGMSKPKTQQPDGKEKIRHDDESKRTLERGLAR